MMQGRHGTDHLGRLKEERLYSRLRHYASCFPMKSNHLAQETCPLFDCPGSLSVRGGTVSMPSSWEGPSRTELRATQGCSKFRPRPRGKKVSLQRKPLRLSETGSVDLQPLSASRRACRTPNAFARGMPATELINSGGFASQIF